MKQETIFVTVDNEGLGRRENPYSPYDPTHEPNTDFSRFDYFSKQNPPLPTYSQNNVLIKGERCEVTPWIRVIHSMSPSKGWQVLDDRIYKQYGYDKKAYDDANPNVATLSIYRQWIDADNLCIVCDEDSSKKSFCADCGLNEADDRQVAIKEEKPERDLAADLMTVKEFEHNKQKEFGFDPGDDDQIKSSAQPVKEGEENIYMQVVKQIRTQVEDCNDYVSDFFVEVYERLGRGSHAVEVKDYPKSNDRLSLLKINDKTVASVIETRTEFNHVEFIFSEQPVITASKEVKSATIAKAKREYETGKIGFVQALEQVYDAAQFAQRDVVEVEKVVRLTKQDNK